MTRPRQKPTQQVSVVVHSIAEDGLPDMDKLVGRVAFIFDGCVVSGWPLDEAEHPEVYERARTGEGLGGAGMSAKERRDAVEQLWEANDDVGHHRPFGGVTHWIEFPEPVWELASYSAD